MIAFISSVMANSHLFNYLCYYPLLRRFAVRNLSAVITTEAWQKAAPEAYPRLVKKAFGELAALQLTQAPPP